MFNSRFVPWLVGAGSVILVSIAVAQQPIIIGEIGEAATVVPRTEIGEKVTVHPRTEIDEKLTVHPRTEIGEKLTVHPRTEIGEKVTSRPQTEIGAAAPHAQKTIPAAIAGGRYQISAFAAADRSGVVNGAYIVDSETGEVFLTLDGSQPRSIGRVDAH